MNCRLFFLIVATSAWFGDDLNGDEARRFLVLTLGFGAVELRFFATFGVLSDEVFDFDDLSEVFLLDLFPAVGVDDG